MKLSRKQEHRSLAKILNQVLESSKGILTGAQTVSENWIYNFIKTGTFQNPYLGGPRIPNTPLNPKAIIEKGLPDLNKLNGRANRYLEYQQRRMEKAREKGDSKLYFAILNGLMRRSIAFRLAFLHRTNKGWYYRRSVNHLFKVLLKMKTVFEKKYVKSERFYIAKANGKLRPIGSPRKEWNTYLCMLSWGLTKWVSPGIKNQHGFLPGKGVWSAWTEFLTRVRHKKNIYGYDYTRCFNTIPLFHPMKAPTFSDTEIGRAIEANYESRNVHKSEISLQSALKYFKIPQDWIIRILELNRSNPTLKVGTELDPTDPEIWHEKYEKGHKGLVSQAPELLSWFGKLAQMKGPKILRMDQEWITIGEHKHLSNKYFGLTQGSPLSPILCNIFQEYWEHMTQVKDVETLKYADDGFYYSDTVNEWELVKDYKESNTKGIKFDPKKSGVLKENGEWKVEEVNFLGSTFNIKNETLGNDKVGHIPLEQISYKNLFKIVGKTYNISIDETWSHEVNEKSLLALLFDSSIGQRIDHTMSIDDTLKIVRSTQISTICMGMALKAIKDKRFEILRTKKT